MAVVRTHDAGASTSTSALMTCNSCERCPERADGCRRHVPGRWHGSHHQRCAGIAGSVNILDSTWRELTADERDHQKATDAARRRQDLARPVAALSTLAGGSAGLGDGDDGVPGVTYLSRMRHRPDVRSRAVHLPRPAASHCGGRGRAQLCTGYSPGGLRIVRCVTAMEPTRTKVSLWLTRRRLVETSARMLTSAHGELYLSQPIADQGSGRRP